MNAWVNKVHFGDNRATLRTMHAAGVKVQCVVTSPPYYGLRSYGIGTENGEIGLEKTPAEYVAALVEVFDGVRELLADDGVLWLNLGDSYANNTKWGGSPSGKHVQAVHGNSGIGRGRHTTGLPGKNLIGIPWRVAFALQAAGWYLRQDIIWCLSGGAAVYARTQKGDMPVMVKDLVRLRPETVKLWNGSTWTQVLGWSRSTDTSGRALEIELRSGERIGCTPGHQWPTNRGLLRAEELRIGDVIATTRLPEPDAPSDAEALGVELAWLCGLYLAEGSVSGDKVQIAGHIDETADRLPRIERVAAAFHGTATVFSKGNCATITIHGSLVLAALRTYIHGKTAHDKGLKVRAWARRDAWLLALLRGYLEGDGHYDAPNDRWRMGFCRNDRLADDLRTLAARLGLPIRLAATKATGFGREWPTYHGDIRLTKTDHHNARQGGEITAIRNSRARQFWDIGVADEPHTFALASGVLTHNSKPNPMPESVTDRCTKAHEYLFLLTKSARYYWDSEAMQEEAVMGAGRPPRRANSFARKTETGVPPGSPAQHREGRADIVYEGTRNRRSVWTVPTQPYSGAHFATFPPALIEPCVLAGSRPGDVVLDPFMGSGTTAQVAQALGRQWIGCELQSDYAQLVEQRTAQQGFSYARDHVCVLQNSC